MNQLKSMMMEFLLLEKLVAVLPISPIDAQGVIK
jgi:hypothetical protein